MAAYSAYRTSVLFRLGSYDQKLLIKCCARITFFILQNNNRKNRVYELTGLKNKIKNESRYYRHCCYYDFFSSMKHN